MGVLYASGKTFSLFKKYVFYPVSYLQAAIIARLFRRLPAMIL